MALMAIEAAFSSFWPLSGTRKGLAALSMMASRRPSGKPVTYDAGPASVNSALNHFGYGPVVCYIG